MYNNWIKRRGNKMVIKAVCENCGKQTSDEDLQKCTRGYFCVDCVNKMVDYYYLGDDEDE